MGIRRLTLTRAIRVARGNDVACREAGDTKSTLISASWPSYTLSSMPLAGCYFKPCQWRSKIVCDFSDTPGFESLSVKVARYSFQEIQEYNSLTLPNVTLLRRGLLGKLNWAKFS